MLEHCDIQFTEGGVDAFEVLITGGLALAVEKTLDKISSDDNHGWYCTITDRITGVKDSRWGTTKEEAQKSALEALIYKIDEFNEEQEDKRRIEQRE